MSDSTVVAALYHFARLENFEEIREPLLALMKDHDVRGTLLLAREGINGTISGTRENIDSVINWLKSDERLANLVHKESYCEAHPFYRTKVKLKKEIVTMGVEDIDPNHIVGTYVKPSDWNDVISDPEVVLIDTRNDYELRVGTFEDAIDLNIRTFRAFPEAIKQLPDTMKDEPVVMFCTGGIRCEKASAIMIEAGFTNVKQLKGGVLGYFEEVGGEHWNGDCFVFDQRVAVNPSLDETDVVVCFACREPLSTEEQASPDYIVGVSCPYCIDRAHLVPLSDE